MIGRRWVVRLGALAIGLIAGAFFLWAGRPRAELASPLAPAPGEVRWLKGQLHAHSDGSGDSDTPVSEVARFYAERGYDFVVVTDHNRITRAEGREDILVLPGVELTVNLRSCSPPPEPGLACLLHVNALLIENGALERREFPLRTDDRREVYQHSVALAREMGGLAQVNHPNMHYGASAALLGELFGVTLLEIANVSEDSNNAGDARHPSTEAIWDALLSAGKRVYGTATDDAHHYWDAAAMRERGEEVFEGGRAFVMVRARNEAVSIRSALDRGEFYSSTGVVLTRNEVRDGVLSLASEAEGARVRFIGQNGKLLRESEGGTAEFPLQDAPAGYLRAVITDAAGRKAWTQPIRVP